MNTKLLTLLAVLVLLSGGAYALMSRQNAAPEYVPAMQEMPAITSGDNVDSESVVQNIPSITPVIVEISNFAFQPKELRIPVGTKVIWKNEDTAHHTVTADKGEFGSRLFGKGETFEFTFNQKGTFSYFCEPHPFMKAAVIVE